MKNQNLFTICIDEEGYYCEGISGTLVEVPEIPDVDSLSDLRAYKYDKSKGALILDDKKLQKIKTQTTKKIPTIEQRIQALEQAMIDIAINN